MEHDSYGATFRQGIDFDPYFRTLKTWCQRMQKRYVNLPFNIISHLSWEWIVLLGTVFMTSIKRNATKNSPNALYKNANSIMNQLFIYSLFIIYMKYLVMVTYIYLSGTYLYMFSPLLKKSSSPIFNLVLFYNALNLTDFISPSFSLTACPPRLILLDHTIKDLTTLKT